LQLETAPMTAPQTLLATDYQLERAFQPKAPCPVKREMQKSGKKILLMSTMGRAGGQ
jgi:hypothetical protein